MQTGSALPPSPPGHPQRPPGGTGAVVAAVFVGLWVVAVPVAGQASGWLLAQVLLIEGLATPGWARPLPAVLAALLAGVPALLLARLPRSAAVRATGGTWLRGCAALGLLGLCRLVPPPLNETYLAALAAAAAVLAWLLSRVRPERRARRTPAPAVAPAEASGPAAPRAKRRARLRPGWPTAPAALAVAAGLVVLLPWTLAGALGGALETVLAVAAAAAVGWLGTAVLAPIRRHGFRTSARAAYPPPPAGAAYPAGPAGAAYPAEPASAGAAGPAFTVLLAGLVAGTGLLPLAAATGQDGAQLAELLLLPPLGFAAAALWVLARRAGVGAAAPVGLLIGLAALGPLAFTDPEEISLVLVEGRDVPFWAAVAAAASLGLALLLGVGYGAGSARRRAVRPARPLAAAAAALLLVGTLGAYAGAGQPGLHGERLFVMLKRQADLSGVDTGRTGPAGRIERATEVYRALVSQAETAQAPLRRQLDRWHLRYTPYYLVNGIEVEGGPAVRAWLSRRPDVDRVLLDQNPRPLPAPVTPRHGSAGPPTGTPWNISAIGADRVRAEFRVDGSGILVGGSDSGADLTHPALAGNFRGGDDSWYDPWNGTTRPTDDNGHGTHTLATAVGGTGVGVAPGARWIGCVNLDRNLGSPAHYLDCLQFMLAPFRTGGDPFTDGRPERGAQVLTNSWGCPPIEGCNPGTLRPATAALATAGVFLAAAAGNTGPRCGSISDPPAPYPEVETIGAVDRNRRVADFSSRGPASGTAGPDRPDRPGGATGPDGGATGPDEPGAGAGKPDLVAPGAGVLSALPGGGYGTLDGTSMATPHVAGVVALIWSANPALIGDLARTRRILRDTAAPVAPPVDGAGGGNGGCAIGPAASGAGLVDAYAAVRAAR
ncbi:S8 family serine peptidase [Plantactinospora siamensis]|uniref:S8 family serine peptidase n=1 Tax=Plantactinospora siamensis TaxID=555372 RepID=A0ABV6P609_9ACTN